MYDFYRVEKVWREEDWICNHEPDTRDFGMLKDAEWFFDLIDAREEFLRERKQHWNPSKFNKTFCVELYGIVVDKDGYEEYHEIDTCAKGYGFRDYEKEEELKRMYDVYNEYDKKIDFDAAQNLMDEEISEELHSEHWFETNQEFFDAYCEKHLEKYGEEFELNKNNPA